MSEEFQFVTTRSPSRSPSLREIAAVFFRNKRLLVAAFTLMFVAGLIYAFFFPSYRAEMKIIVRRGRTDPAVAPTPTVSPVVDRDEITEEEMNSEVDLLHDNDILRRVAVETGLAGNALWLSKLSGDNDEIRIEHATRRLARKLQVQPLRKSRLITVTYSSSDPRMSAAVLSSLAADFLEKQTEIRRPSGQQVFFELQMNESRQALERAVAGADAVYTDAWTSMGQEQEEGQRAQIFPPYQVNAELMAEAASHAVFMHCLPAHRGLEVTDAVIDSQQSVVFEQAENRLHVQKAILYLLLGGGDRLPARSAHA